MNDDSRMRAGDAERRRTADALSDELAAGRLTMAEFEERSSAAWGAVTVEELRGLLGDLTPDPAAAVAGGEVAVRGRGAVDPVTGERGGSAWAVGVLGGSSRTGAWLCAPSMRAVGVLGGAELDFTRARMAARETAVTAVGVLGGVDVHVPEDWRIVVDDLALLGGVDVVDEPGVTLAGSEVPDDAPVLRIRALAVLGGVDVHRVPVRRR
ncbi:DUF1707 SHOCT-like domain-containing protein [Corynebacterium sp. 335C]